MGANQNYEFNNYFPPSSERKLKSHQKICLINLRSSLINNDNNENNLSQNEIKLICQNCRGANNNFYKCFDCEKILCQNCVNESRHDKLIEYELFNIIVISQLQCFKNGGSNYESNLVNISEDLRSNINLDELKQKIKTNNETIDDIINKLNKIKESLNFYYEVNCIVNDNLKKKNYEIKKTNDNIKSDKKVIISEIKKTINENKFKDILNNLEKICDFKTPSNNRPNKCTELNQNNQNNQTRNNSTSPNNNNSENIDLIEDTTQNIEKKEEIVMKLKFEKNNNLEYIRIFGDKFVENNKQCKMHIENEYYGVTVYKNSNSNNNSNSTQNSEKVIQYEDINSKIDLEGKDLDKDFIIHLKSPNIITNLSDMFCNCQNLFSFEVISSDNLNITNMSNMFCNCNSLNSLNISRWTISNVTDINGIFFNCKKLEFESILPSISDWDTSKVTDMSYAFSNCESLESLDIIKKWDTSKVEKMNGMFKDSIHLKNIPDDLMWDTSNVNNMNFMFCHCEDLDNIKNLSKLNFSKVNDMNNIFAECTSLKNISNFSIEDALNVTDISYMFYNCTKLDTLPEKFEFNENIITDISYMFYNTKFELKDKIKIIKSKFLDNNRYPKADKTEILKGLNKNVNCAII